MKNNDKIETALAIAGCLTATAGNLTGKLGGWETVALYAASFALYQGTSVVKILKEVR